MKKAYSIENASLFKKFLEVTFFKAWKSAKRIECEDGAGAKYYSCNVTSEVENYPSLEMALDYRCDLRCKYCYYKRHGKDLFSGEEVRPENILSNTKKLMDFIYENQMTPQLGIFSGEAFILPHIWDVFDIIYDTLKKYDEVKRPNAIVIPTNCSFLVDGNEKIKERVLEYIKKFAEIKVLMPLSASIDGPLLDVENRAPASRKERYNENFYNNVKFFHDNFNMGVHPMVYSNRIENWIDNFLWFYDKFKNIYLLEVRNTEWTEEQCWNLYYFLKFLIHFLYKECGRDKERLINFLKKQHSFNILNSPFVTTGRGLGCSIQSSLELNMNNLAVMTCHRTSYKELLAGYLKIEDAKNFDFEPANVELYIAMQSTQSKQIAPCNVCPISKLCNGTCLGANYEATGDLFTADPAVCRMEHLKVAGIINALKEVNLLDYFMGSISAIEKSQVNFILNNFKE